MIIVTYTGIQIQYDSMTLDFSDYDPGDEITIRYTLYDSIGVNRERKETEVNTVVAAGGSVNDAGALRWKAGETGIGIVRPNGHVFD